MPLAQTLSAKSFPPKSACFPPGRQGGAGRALSPGAWGVKAGRVSELPLRVELKLQGERRHCGSGTLMEPKWVAA